MPEKKAFFIILGYKTSRLQQQQYLTMIITTEMIAQATRKVAKILKLNPAFLMKFASKVESL
jgi:hypothetical protein